MGYVNDTHAHTHTHTYRRACNLNGLKFDNGILDLLLKIFLSLGNIFRIELFYRIYHIETIHITHPCKIYSIASAIQMNTTHQLLVVASLKREQNILILLP